MAAPIDTSAGFSYKFRIVSCFTILLMLTLIQLCRCEEIPLTDSVGTTDESRQRGETTESANDDDNIPGIPTKQEAVHERDDAELDDLHLPDPVHPDEDPSLIRQDKDFYSFSVEDSEGGSISLTKYRGKVTLVVNVASECGFTDGHYKGLIRLKNTLSTTKMFEILAFPCNQFGAQEPGSNEDIQKFVRDTYHSNFPVFAKINVIEENIPEPWQYLISSYGGAPNWNFWKYLVDENGHVVNAWGPWTHIEDIFHEVKEAVDKIGYEKPKHYRHGGEL